MHFVNFFWVKTPCIVQWNVNIMIIIIVNFCGAYILRNLSSEAQQNIIIKHNREQGRAKVVLRTRDNRSQFRPGCKRDEAKKGLT